MSETEIPGIIAKTNQWKAAFKTAVDQVTKRPITQDPSQMSFVEILTHGGDKINDALIQQTIKDGIHTIGTFTPAQLGLIHSDAYTAISLAASDVFEAYDINTFAAQREAGPIIGEIMNHDQGIKIGLLFHPIGRSRIIEAFYETSDKKRLLLPDTFAYHFGNFHTVKPIRDMTRHPVLGPRMKELNL